jgi:choline dehydrogenase
VTREVIPGAGNPTDYRFRRDAAVTYWHQSGTARMGRDDLMPVRRRRSSAIPMTSDSGG